MESQHRERTEPARVRARDAALRRTRALIVGVAAGAVALSGALSVVAAQAFKGHSSNAAPAQSARVHVPAPQAIPEAGDDGATPLQPPAQPPAASNPAPDPQVSGGS